VVLLAYDNTLFNNDEVDYYYCMKKQQMLAWFGHLFTLKVNQPYEKCDKKP